MNKPRSAGGAAPDQEQTASATVVPPSEGCRGQVISDTPIGESGGCRFVVGGSSIAESGMEPDAVVEADDVVGDVSDGFSVIGIVALPNPFHLQIQEEAFHDGVIPAVALAAHAGDKAVLREQGPYELGWRTGIHDPNARSAQV